jgi:hypothetical protein
VAVRGLKLLVVPQLFASASTAALNVVPIVQMGFGVLLLVGLRARLRWLDRQTPAAGGILNTLSRKVDRQSLAVTCML